MAREWTSGYQDFQQHHQQEYQDISSEVDGRLFNENRGSTILEYLCCSGWQDLCDQENGKCYC